MTLNVARTSWISIHKPSSTNIMVFIENCEGSEPQLCFQFNSSCKACKSTYTTQAKRVFSSAMYGKYLQHNLFGRFKELIAAFDSARHHPSSYPAPTIQIFGVLPSGYVLVYFIVNIIYNY